MQYPNHIITLGEQDSSIVKHIQHQLNQLGFGPLAEDGIFGPLTRQSVKAFQQYENQEETRDMTVDGKVDLLTWGNLGYYVSLTLMPPLLLSALKFAEKEVGVKEVPPGSNRGPRVEEYLKSVRLVGGYPWCAAFVYWCVEQASASLNRLNPLPRNGSCMRHWHQTKGEKITCRQVLDNYDLITGKQTPENDDLIKPGDIFIISRQGGKGHTVFVYDVLGTEIVTIEGNANAFHSTEGDGVVKLQRKIDSINVGFIRYC